MTRAGAGGTDTGDASTGWDTLTINPGSPDHEKADVLAPARRSGDDRGGETGGGFEKALGTIMRTCSDECEFTAGETGGDFKGACGGNK